MGDNWYEFFLVVVVYFPPVVAQEMIGFFRRRLFFFKPRPRKLQIILFLSMTNPSPHP